ncbi:MAG: O-antigen ligase family protein, partial [Pseudomonadota bacterium]|nr:O-antigen ligase family protein [Pseudomonadota bacterium]
RAPVVVRQAAAPANRPAAPRMVYAAQAAAPPAVPARTSNTFSLVLAGVMLAIFSKTWMLVALGGGRVGWDAPAWFQAVFLPAYGIGAILALQRFPSALAAAARSPALLSLVLLAGISVGWSVAPTTTFLGAAALAATTLAAFALASRFDWADLVETVAVVFAVLTVGSIVAGLVIPALGHDPNHPGNWRGLWFSKNSLGGNMAHAFLIFGSAALFRRRRAWLWWLMAVLSLLPLLMSGSKTALAAWLLGAAAFVFVALVRRGAAASIVFTYAALLGAAVLAGLVMFAGDSLAALAGKDATLTGRTDIWEAALRQIGERPLLGFGYSAFWETQEGATAWVRNDAGWKVTDAHNAWLEVWLGLGLVGLMLWCFVFAGAWVRSLVSVYRHGSPISPCRGWLSSP